MRTDTSPKTQWVNRLLVVDAIGLFLFLFGMQPGLLGLPHREGFGYFKILVFLTALAVITLASYAVATLMRPEDHTASLFQEVGARLMATGYFLAAFCSIVDLIGVGSERFPLPMHFGYLQSSGFLLGVAIILVGLLAYYPRNKNDPN